MPVQNYSFLSAVKKSWLIGLVVLFTTIVLSGCGGGNNGSNNKEQTTTLNGQVVDDPISDADIYVYDKNGTEILHKTQATDQKGSYSLTIDNGKISSMPVIIKIEGGKIANGDPFNDTMYSICFKNTCNVTPITTILYQSFISNLKSIKAEDVSQFASKYLGISNWQSTSLQEIKNFRQYVKDNDQGIENIASTIANDISDGYIDDNASKSILPHANLRVQKTSNFSIDKKSLENIDQRNFKLMNLVTGQESGIDGSVSYKDYGLEAALVEYINYTLPDGTPESKIDIVYLPFSEYSKTKLNSNSTIFNLVFKDLTLSALNPTEKKKLIDILITKYSDELKKLVDIHHQYINDGVLHWDDFKNGIEDLQNLLKEKYVSNGKVIENRVLSRTGLVNSRALRKAIIDKNFIDFGPLAIKHKPADNQIIVGNILPTYWGLASYSDYENFKNSGGENHFNPSTLLTSFNHNLILPNSGGLIGTVDSSAFKNTLNYLSLNKGNFGMGEKTPMTYEDFDSDLANNKDLNDYSNKYVFYKSWLNLSSLQGLLNIATPISKLANIPIKNKKNKKSLEKMKETFSKVKDKSKNISYMLSSISTTADAITDAFEILINLFNNDKNKEILGVNLNSIQSWVSTFKNIHNNASTLVQDINSAFNLGYTQDNVLGDLLENPNQGKIKALFSLIGLKNVFVDISHTGDLLDHNFTIPSYQKISLSKKFKNLLAAAILYEVVGKAAEEELKGTTLGIKYFNTKNFIDQIYLMINVYETKNEDTNDVLGYAKKLKKENLLVIENKKLTNHVYRHELRQRARNVALLLLKHLGDKDVESNIEVAKKEFYSKIMNYGNVIKVYKFISGQVNALTNMDIGQKLHTYIKSLVLPILYNFVDNFTPGKMFDAVIGEAVEIMNPYGAGIKIAEGANILAGQVVSFTNFPNKIIFGLKADEKGENISFNIPVPAVAAFKKGIFLDNSKHFGPAFLANSPYLIVTNQNNTPYYRPFYETIFKDNQDTVKNYLENAIDDGKFIGVDWKYLECKGNAVSKNDIDTNQCQDFKNNQLSKTFTGDELKDFIKPYYSNNAVGSYFDYTDALAYKWCRSYTTLGYFRCSVDKSNFNVYNETPGVFLETVDTKLYNLDKVPNDSVIDSPKVSVPFFKIADVSQINVDITQDDNGIAITNNSNSNFSYVIIPSSSLDISSVPVSMVTFPMEDVIKAGKTITIPSSKISDSIGLSSNDSDIDVLVVDNILNYYKKYMGYRNLLTTLDKIKGEGNSLKEFINYYSNENFQYSFIKREHFTLGEVNHSPLLYPIDVEQDTDNYKDVNVSIYAQDKDHDPLTVSIDYGDGNIDTKSYVDVINYSDNMSFSHTYDNDGNYTITVTVSDDKGATATQRETVDIEKENITTIEPEYDPAKQATLFPGHTPGSWANLDAFAALKNDGTVVTWGGTGGDSSSVADKLNNVKAVYSNWRAFAALKNDGTVVTWGRNDWGGDSSSVADKLTNVKAVYSTEYAFAALKNDGTVVTWGGYGGDSSSVADKLTNVKAIYSTGSAFAALKNDGTVVTWGDSNRGGDSSSVADKLTNVKAIYSTGSAFAALKNDGTVVTWGDGDWGGDSSSVADKLTNVKAIYSTGGAFAALKNDGTVVTWGYSNRGGDSSSVADKLTNVKVIYSTEYAFAALKNDGTVVAWGDSNHGGDSSSVADKLTNVKAIYSTYDAFAALKNDGTVVTWGGYGGDSSSVADKLTNVKTIYSTLGAFAALKNDGTVVAWGDSNQGGDSSSVADKLTNVKAIYSTYDAFAALKNDGTVVTWGVSDYGGDSSSVADKLKDIKIIYPSCTRVIYNR